MSNPGAFTELGNPDLETPGRVDQSDGGVSQCCISTQCTFPEETFCVTLTSETDQFYDLTFSHSFLMGGDDGWPNLPNFVPATSFSLYGNIPSNSNSPMGIYLSGSHYFEDEDFTICYRFFMRFFFQCVVEDGVFCYRVGVLHPKDLIAVHAEAYHPRVIDVICVYTTIEQYYGWGNYAYQDFGSGPVLVFGITTPPDCLPGHTYVYSYDETAFFSEHNGVIASGEFFSGCGNPCFPTLPSESRGIRQRIVWGAPVPIANPMDLSVTVPGDWFKLVFCGGDFTFDDFNLDFHLEGPADIDCNIVEYLQTPCSHVAINEDVKWCPPFQTTTTTSTTTTSTTTTNTTTTTTSTTSTTTTSTTTSTTTTSPPDDTREFCCPDGASPDTLICIIGVDNPDCNCFVGGATLTWISGENAYVASYPVCGDAFSSIRLYCVPDGSGGGTWYAEMHCDGIVVAIASLAVSGDGATADGSGPVTSSACCPFEGVTMSFLITPVGDGPGICQGTPM